jgi:hypothetical protein
VDKVALGEVFSEYFGFTCQFSFHRLLHTHLLSSGAGTIDQLVADVPSGLSLTAPQETRSKKKKVTSYDGRDTVLGRDADATTSSPRCHNFSAEQHFRMAVRAVRPLVQQEMKMPTEGGGNTASNWGTAPHLAHTFPLQPHMWYSAWSQVRL